MTRRALIVAGAVIVVAAAAVALALSGAFGGGDGTNSVGGGSSSSEGNAAVPVASATASQVQATTWQAQDTSSASGPIWLNSVTFVDATHGWAVGYTTDSNDDPAGGLILATSDGGASWHEQDASSAGGDAEFYSVSFADANHGWAVGDKSDSATGQYIGGVILATKDGGATWHAQSSTGSGADLYSVNCVDAKHCWTVGHREKNVGLDSTPTISSSGNPIGLILATSDGGATWHEQDASSTGDGAGLDSVSFIDVKHGWAVGGRGDDNGDSVDGVILVTSDGGDTWQAQDASR